MTNTKDDKPLQHDASASQERVLGEPHPKARLRKEAVFADLGYTPHAGQLEIHRSPALRRVVACGVRWGKSKLAAMEAVAALLEPRESSRGWIVAPTLDLCDKIFREIAVITLQHLRHRVVLFKDFEKRLVVRNMAGGLSEVRGKTADNPVSLLGEGLNWLVIDEAAQLRPVIWESYLSQRLLDHRGWALMISTPRGRGWFHNCYLRGQGRDPDYASWNYASSTNPYLDAEAIERERERLPDRVFREQYGGEFCEGSGQVFRNVRECATGEFSPPISGEDYVAGLDLARSIDFTVLVILDSNCRVVYVDRFHRIDWHLQVVRIKAALDRYNNCSVLIDSTGKGEPIYEALCAEGCYADAYTFTSKSKMALVDNLSLMIERRLVTLPKPELWPTGIDELEAFEFSVTESGTTRTSAPSGVHDDAVIALALACWQRRPPPPPPKILYLDWPRPIW